MNSSSIVGIRAIQSFAKFTTPFIEGGDNMNLEEGNILRIDANSIEYQVMNGKVHS